MHEFRLDVCLKGRGFVFKLNCEIDIIDIKLI